jgi:hypothetical protein
MSFIGAAERYRPAAEPPKTHPLVEYYDGLWYSDHDAWLEAKHEMRSLSPKVILANHGPEVLAWAVVNAGTFDRADELGEVLFSQPGYEKELFHKARLWCWQEKFSSRGKDVLAQYALEKALTSKSLGSIDMPALLKAAALPGIELSDKRLDDYALLPAVTEERQTSGWVKGWRANEEGNIVYGLYLDTPTGVILTYKDRPNAIAGMAMNTPGELMLYQMQGVKAKEVDHSQRHTDDFIVRRISSRGLMPIDWRKLFVNLTGHIGAGRNRTPYGAGSRRQSL